jgi:hypothetical protein
MGTFVVRHEKELVLLHSIQEVTFCIANVSAVSWTVWLISPAKSPSITEIAILTRNYSSVIACCCARLSCKHLFIVG